MGRVPFATPPLPLLGLAAEPPGSLSSTDIHMGTHLTVTPGGLEKLLWPQLRKQEAGTCEERILGFI